MGKESILVGRTEPRTPFEDQYRIVQVDNDGNLIVIPIAGGIPFDVNLVQVLSAALNPANPVIVGVFDAAGNRMPSGDDPARQIYVEGSGLNTNPERWLHDNHWEPDAEIPIVLAGAPGELAVGGAVPAGEVRRIREVTVRHAGTANTVVSILDETGGNIKVTVDVPAQSSRTWSSQDGRAIAATLQPVVQSSDVTGGNTFVSIAGVEAE